MDPRLRHSSNRLVASADGPRRRETKACPHASSGREAPIQIPGRTGDDTDELPGNVDSDRRPPAQLTAYSNAPSESFFNSLKNERVHGSRYETRDAARADVFEYIEIFYNRVRRHTSLGGVSPALYYENWLKKQSQKRRAA
jgi:hypothetical protein